MAQSLPAVGVADALRKEVPVGSAEPQNRFLASFYPESRFGGFSDIDGTIAFYVRVNALVTPDSIVVDFGCGIGAYREDPVQIRRELRVLKGKVRKVVGLDIDAAAAANPFVDEFLLLGEEGLWPLPSHQADLVLCDNVLEHLERPELFFQEAARVLKPGGSLCIRTPNVLSYVGVISRLVPNRWHGTVVSKVQASRRAEDVFPTYYRCNTVWRLRRMLARHSFDGVVYGYEAEPSYLNFSKLAYALGVVHQKLAPSLVRPALFAFARLREKRTDVHADAAGRG